ncbi:nucleoside triphosphate pyrophosphatase [Schaalia sp. JY-X169]|uniref:Maf family protein n=1 Tax=Schaalia sp. JY-X169 TaxID=2758572 RepID=UPI0015F5BF69|nr:nucleoside triphosphate pyrophosphatase [Schaalia sp. JY-X169]
MRLVLGSKSPARLATLRSAGVDPVVIVSDVDEDAVAAALPPDAAPAQVVSALALAKAQAVAAEVSSRPGPGQSLILGCDSMLEINGRIVGKPHTAEVAKERIAEMRNTDAVLWTGHALLSVDAEGNADGEAVEAASTVVHFGDISDAEIDAYVATGEPLNVAGSFTIDGFGGPFVRGVTGDPHSVVGVSLPLLRDLAGRLGVFWPDLWNRA